MGWFPWTVVGDPSWKSGDSVVHTEVFKICPCLVCWLRQQTGLAEWGRAAIDAWNGVGGEAMRWALRRSK